VKATHTLELATDVTDGTHGIAVVVPVYQGETVLPALLEEIDVLSTVQLSPRGHRFRVTEVILVHDYGPDRSDETIRALANLYLYVRPVWLSRNFGTHAATLAGIAASRAEWIVTMDEDGQHDPNVIGEMLDAALAARSPLVYAEPLNPAPHSAFRNLTSGMAHAAARAMGGPRHFHSFRLLLGDLGRGLATSCGESVYLDIALTWVVSDATTVPVLMREERGRPSGFSTAALASHFWRMVLTSGTRPLRIVTLLGALLGVAAGILSIWVLWNKLTNQVPVLGYTSLMVVLLVTSGAILFSMGIIAEYLGITVKTAMGKPVYLAVDDYASGPLGRPDSLAAVQSADATNREAASPAQPSSR
jgi:polyisoprenyl-phosphate glycosyltransferase